MPGESRPVLDRLVGYALSLLVAAIAVYAAVRLIEAIWSALLVILGGSLIAVVLVALWRSRTSRW